MSLEWFSPQGPLSAAPFPPTKVTLEGTDPYHKGGAVCFLLLLGISTRDFIQAGGPSETVSREAVPLHQALPQSLYLQRH